MTRGGTRSGAGRPKKPDTEKAKRYTFRLYEWEVQQVRNFISSLRIKKQTCQNDREDA